MIVPALSVRCHCCPACSTAAAEAAGVIKDKFMPALDASILRQQNVMEGLYHDLKKSESKMDAQDAGGFKAWVEGGGRLHMPGSRMVGVEKVGAQKQGRKQSVRHSRTPSPSPCVPLIL